MVLLLWRPGRRVLRARHLLIHFSNTHVILHGVASATPRGPGFSPALFSLWETVRFIGCNDDAAAPSLQLQEVTEQGGYTWEQKKRYLAMRTTWAPRR